MNNQSTPTTTLTMPELADSPSIPATHLDPDLWRQTCLDLGADDVGFVSIDRPELDDQRDDILAAFPRARTLISYVCRMNREPIRTPARSIANLEFHHTGHQVDQVGRDVVTALEQHGIGAINPAMGFPMETQHFPDRMWVVSHKPVAVAAGLGRIGIHRNVIHPRFGNFILLGTIITDADVSVQGRALTGDVCMSCKLCVAACPVGAIGSDGYFDFSACYTHNYREFMGGFTDWAETIAGSKSATDYRKQVSDPESVSMWQSLSFGANYKAAYCLAVCPAGEDVRPPFDQHRKEFVETVVRPLSQQQEAVYVVPDSDAETYVKKRFPHKTVRRVGSGIRPRSIHGFLTGMRHLFQRGKAGELDATYHFTFTGDESAQATVVIRDRTLSVTDGHQGKAQLKMTADARAWLGFLAGDRGLAGAILTRKVRLKGNLKWLLAFARCFPSLKR